MKFYVSGKTQIGKGFIVMVVTFYQIYHEFALQFSAEGNKFGVSALHISVVFNACRFCIIDEMLIQKSLLNVLRLSFYMFNVLLKENMSRII